MRKFIIGLALASTAAMAAPAAAQYQDTYRGNGYDQRGRYQDDYRQGGQVEQQLGQLRQRIGRVTQRGAVSRNEGIRLQRQLALIERRYDYFARNGLNSAEQYDIQQRIQALRAQIREDRQDGRYQSLERGYQDDGRYNSDRRYDDRRGDDRYYDRRDRDDD